MINNYGIDKTYLISYHYFNKLHLEVFTYYETKNLLKHKFRKMLIFIQKFVSFSFSPKSYKQGNS